MLPLAGRRGQRSDEEEEEEEEGEVDEDEEETVKKSGEEKDSDGEVAKTENKEEGGQVKFTPITPTKIVIRLIGRVISLLIGFSDGQPVRFRKRVPAEKRAETSYQTIQRKQTVPALRHAG